MDFGDVKLDLTGHSGVLITTPSGRKIAIDPYNVSSNVGKVDVILITHSHYDHCSIKDIQSISKNKTIIVIPADAQSKIAKVENIEMQIMEVGDEITLGNLKIEALPAYNINKEFHPKSEGWLGYLIKRGNTIIYHSGDTDKIKEMEKLSGYGKKENHFVAFLPVSGTYVMDPEQAAKAAQMIKADLYIPIHYGAGVAGTEDDANRFVELCKKEGLHARVLEKI